MDTKCRALEGRNDVSKNRVLALYVSGISKNDEFWGSLIVCTP